MMMASIYYSLDYFSLSSNVKFFILMFTFSLLLNNTKCLSVANQQQNGPGAAPFDHHQRNTIDATNTNDDREAFEMAGDDPNVNIRNEPFSNLHFQIPPHDIGYLLYGNLRIKIYQHVANNKRNSTETEGSLLSLMVNGSKKNLNQFYYEPIALLDHRSAKSVYNNITKEAEMKFRVQMWTDDVQAKVVDWIKEVIDERVSKKLVQVLPYDKLVLSTISHSFQRRYILSTKWKTYQSQKDVEFKLGCFSRKECDYLATEMSQRSSQFSELQILFSFVSHHSLLRTKPAFISVQNIMEGGIVSKLNEQMAYANFALMSTEDEQHLLHESVTNILINSFDDSKDVVASDSKTQLNRFIKSLLFHPTKIIITKLSGSQVWSSVFWKEVNYRPDRASKILNQVYKKQDKETQILMVYAIEMAKNKLHKERFLNGWGIKFRTPVYVDLKSEERSEDIPLTQEQLDAFFDECKNQIEWDGEMFTPRPLSLSRFNLTKLMDSQTYQGRIVQVKYTTAISLLLVNIKDDDSEDVDLIKSTAECDELSRELQDFKVASANHVNELQMQLKEFKKDCSVNWTNIDKDQRHNKHHSKTEMNEHTEIICLGTNRRMAVPPDREHHYRNLRDRYANCTYVDGNLELTWLQDEHLDLSFLQHIREVTGYVLISHVDVKRIVLPNLQIIRGRTLFKLSVHNEEFALVVTLSKMHNLEMPALRDILAGSSGILNNYNLCHIKTINWEEIITGPGSKYVWVYNFTEPERECLACHESCEAGCWGEGAVNCQKFSKINCSPQCHEVRCFGPKPRECCHRFCTGGCTGPKQSDCLACRNFSDDGVCKQECPAMQRYNPITYSWEMNPKGKYAYGATCVKPCPEHWLKDNGTCVRTCPPKKKAVNGECVVCDGPCPKTCKGVDIVHVGNIDSFRDCTVIEGSITILDHSFAGFQQIYPNFTFGPRYSRMHPDRLKMFATLREITGFINIQASHADFRNLSYFRNLDTIGGRQLTEYFSALYIVKTSLTSLNLRSLKMIRTGSVAILENKELCFAESISWTKIIKSQQHGTLLQNNKLQERCKEAGLVCSAQCSSEGCWALGPDECLSCAYKQLGSTCVESCDLNLGVYESAPKFCKHCHHECDKTCTGPGPENCTKCKNVKDGPYCVPICPVSKFNSYGECLPCHENCIGGCQGPDNNVGPNGCRSCGTAVINEDDDEGNQCQPQEK